MLPPNMRLHSLTFTADARIYNSDQGKDYPYKVEIEALLPSDGQTLIITDVSIVKGA